MPPDPLASAYTLQMQQKVLEIGGAPTIDNKYGRIIYALMVVCA